MVLAIIFFGASVPVYVLGMRSTHPATEVTYTATVSMPAHIADARTIETQLASPPWIDRAFRRLRLAAGKELIRRIAERVHVGATEEPTARQLQIKIGLTTPDEPARSRQLVNAMAGEFVESERSKLAAKAAATHAEALKAANEAQQRRFEATTRFEAFLDHYFEELALADEGQALSSQPKTTPPPVSNPTPPPPSPPRLAVHPETARLQQQLASLRQYREQLLVNRTPLHPQVREADVEIADLEHRLAATSHELVPSPENLSQQLKQMEPPPVPPPGPVTPEPRVQPSPPTLPIARDALVQMYQTKRNEVNQARQDYQRLADLERETWQAQFQLPSITVEPAVATAAPVPSGHSPRLLLVALAVGLAGAVGIGMFTTGVSGEPTLADVAEAQAALGVPVLGTLPAADRDGPRRRRGSTDSWILVLCGLLLTTLCIGAMLAFIAGLKLG
ncbi:MAG: hypothetical protein JW818_20775 [Pirellulales bacterium]|nr:hypothetical protein [Pirellulales bacterium]